MDGNAAEGVSEGARCIFFGDFLNGSSIVMDSDDGFSAVNDDDDEAISADAEGV